jgi:hypothetical protein
MLVSPAAWWQGFARGVPKITREASTAGEHRDGKAPPGRLLAHSKGLFPDACRTRLASDCLNTLPAVAQWWA